MSRPKGFKHSEETKRKIRESNRFTHVGQTPWNKGMTFPYKERPSAKGRKIWNKGIKTGIIPRSAFKKGRKMTIEEIRKCLRRRPMSSLEIKVQKVIDLYKLPYKFVGNGKFFIERKNPYFININGKKVAIEVYSRIHKEKFRQGGVEQWQQERIGIFDKYGWKIIFIEDRQTNKEEDILLLLKGGY